MLSSFHEEPVLIAFTAVNCGPCKLQKQELAAFRDMMMMGKDAEGESRNEHRSGGGGGTGLLLKMIAIDTEKWPHVGTRFAVKKLPCVIVMKDNRMVLRLEGLTTAEVLAEQVRSHLGGGGNDSSNSSSRNSSTTTNSGATGR